MMSVNGIRQLVEEFGSSTVDQVICLMANTRFGQSAFLKSSYSNTLIAWFKLGENKVGDMGMFVSTVNIR